LYTIVSLTSFFIALLYSHNTLINEKSHVLDHVKNSGEDQPSIFEADIYNKIVNEDVEDIEDSTTLQYSINTTILAAHILKDKYSHTAGVILLLWHESYCLIPTLNMVYCMLTLLMKFIQKIVFGQLRMIERQHLKEKFWNFVFYKFIFIFGVMNVETISEILVWVTWFAATVFLLLLTKLCRDRFEFLSFSPNTPMFYHYKVCALLFTILCSCIAMAVSCVMQSSPFYLISKEEMDLHEIVFMLTECVMIFIKTTHVIIRYGIHLKDIQQEELWEQKATILYHVDLVMEVSNLVVKLIHHVHMLLSNSVWLSMASLVICMQLRYIFVEIQKRFKKHKNYRRVVANMEAQFPEATQQQILENEDHCAICWETMESARRLPCGHLFHSPCLRSWLEQDTSCPTCRKQLDIQKSNRPSSQNIGADDDIADDDTTTENSDSLMMERHTNHQWHFDGSRFASWLPSFYVHVQHSTTGTRDRADVTARISTTTTNTNTELENMVREVHDIFPHIQPRLIRNDLMMTRSVEMTTENILENRINTQPSNRQAFNRQPLRSLMSFQQRLRQRRGLNLIDRGLRQARSAQSNTTNSEGSTEEVAPQDQSIAPRENQSRHSHTSQRGDDVTKPESVAPPPQPAQTVARPQGARYRSQAQVRTARLRYLRDRAPERTQVSFPLASYNTNGSSTDRSRLMENSSDESLD